MIVRHPIETAVVVIALAAGSAMSWWVYINGRTVSFFIDAVAHLNFARLMTDSMTPGLSQIGYWPPLLHILMAPFAAITPLYESGLAGAFLLVPVLAIGALALYRIVYELVSDEERASARAEKSAKEIDRQRTPSALLPTVLGIGAVLIYLLNPHVLFYSAVPMMELLFMTTVIVSAYFFLRWQRKGRLSDLILLGIFVALSAMARFEGVLLLPFAAVLVVAGLLHRGASRRRIEAIIIIFSMVAVVGTGFIMFYDWAYGGHPLIFMGGGEKPRVDVPEVAGEGTDRLSKDSIYWSIAYLKAASFRVNGPAVVYFALFGGILAALLSRRRFEMAGTMLILLLPMVAMIYALYRGTHLEVPDFPPFGTFNLRYALMWMGFAAVASSLGVYALVGYVSRHIRTVNIKPLATVCVLLIVVGIAGAVNLRLFTSDKVFSAWPQPVEKTRTNIAAHFDAHYDYGKILVSRFNGEYVIQEMNLSLSNLIQEANWRYYQNALYKPWLYARWVIMGASASRGGLIGDGQLVAVEDLWSNNPEFLHYYEPVANNGGLTLYKVKEHAVHEYLARFGVPHDRAPSLNAHMRRWNPDMLKEMFEAQGIQ